MTEYYRVIVSAHSDENAKEIANGLVEKKLAVMARINKAPTTYWWDDVVVEDDDYWHIQCYTIGKKKSAFKKKVTELTNESHPMVCFLPIEDPNEKMVLWFDKYLK